MKYEVGHLNSPLFPIQNNHSTVRKRTRTDKNTPGTHTDFASCAMNHTFTATIMCRQEQKAMNTCMMKYANQAEMDAARAEWFATIDQRKQQREEKEEKRKKDEVFWRQWWDKDLSKKPGEAGEGK